MNAKSWRYPPLTVERAKSPVSAKAMYGEFDSLVKFTGTPRAAWT